MLLFHMEREVACSTSVYLCSSSCIYLLPGISITLIADSFLVFFSRLSLYEQIFLRSSVCSSVSVTGFRVSGDL